ncbi:MAG: DUF1573 domain-containing protein [Candidatus Zixiibacteriota bacterium]
MRRSLIFLSFTLFFFFPFILSSAQKLKKTLPASRIQLKERFWDFGHIPNCAKVSRIFQIENQGSDTLIITRVRSDCGCTHTPLSKSKIAPGEMAELELIFDPRKFHGQIQKAVSIASNDKDTPLSDIVFTAQVDLKNSMVRLNPEGLLFDTLAPNQEMVEKVDVENISGSEIFISVVLQPKEFIDCGIGKLELSPGESTQINFKIRPPLPPGHFRTSMTLEFTGAEKTRCTIPIQGIVSR